MYPSKDVRQLRLKAINSQLEALTLEYQEAVNTIRMLEEEKEIINKLNLLDEMSLKPNRVIINRKDE